jgi:hypothetical protein
MCNKFQNITVIAFVLAVGTGTANAATLVTNGSFEDVTNFVDNNSQDTMSLPFGSTAMTDWTVIGQNDSLAWIGPNNPFVAVKASDGSYFLDLTGFQDRPPYAGVAQTIATQAGSEYLLSFDLGSSLYQGLQDGILAAAGSQSEIFTSTNPGVNNLWQTETMLFTASSNTTLISLLGNSGSSYIGLDNVSVTFVSGTPLPAALPLFVTGLGVMGLFGWRRKRNAAATLAAA